MLQKKLLSDFFSHSWKLSRNVIKWSVSRLTEEKRNQFLQSLAKQCDKSIFYLICEFILFRGRLMSSRVENNHNDTIHLKVVKLYVLPLLPLSYMVRTVTFPYGYYFPKSHFMTLYGYLMVIVFPGSSLCSFERSICLKLYYLLMPFAEKRSIKL